jgi:NADPH-dependent 2,4-dienoyl-CoA reductase/sulfur reductase-like enzyme
MELAALAAESGHRVRLWEATDVLDGQLRLATRTPGYEQYATYLDWQERRLDRVGVEVLLGRRASVEEVAGAGADVVAVATGAVSYRPRIPGVAHAVDIREVLEGRVEVGPRVLIVAQDDHLPPLSLADLLSERGHEVTVVYATAAPAAQLGRYILGGILARLHRRGVRFRHLEEVTAIAPGAVEVRNVYSRAVQQVADLDSVVLACGGAADSALYEELRTRLPEVHVLGDAFAPRRLVSATRQAYALAKILRDS